ncbi:hypothetical protein [Caulobacter radicis]|uniref:Uncharacterized protein n=1 Tax=Caulobacter radicis TaxID=2172650 RepID=A0A2T9J3L4_9CAUL|nr:hypothetical protein [Caulobacter radicis]PVM75165.1 hypothetical protein DDF65_18580 [Caulobacter radicis]
MAQPLATAPAGAPEAKACRYCASPLLPGSVLCTACNQWQELRYQFRPALTPAAILSVLTTTVPVLVLALAFFKTTLQDPGSSVKTSVLVCTRQDVLLTVSNTGNRSAVLIDGTVTMRDGVSAEPAIRHLRRDDLPMVLKPGDPRPLSLTMQFAPPLNAKAPMPQKPIEGRKCTYEIVMNIVDFKGEKRTAPGQTCQCP